MANGEDAPLLKWATENGHTLEALAGQLGYKLGYMFAVLRGYEEFNDRLLGNFCRNFPQDIPFFLNLASETSGTVSAVAEAPAEYSVEAS